MRITVAMRVIGGFVAISLLLVVISAVSLYNLNSVGSATDEVNEVALPTLSGSNALKASFLNMGRLTFEAYIEEDISGLEEKEASFNASRENFEKQYALLAKAVSNDPELKKSLNTVKASYDDYIDNVETMYTSHRAYMSMRNEIDDKLGVAEDNAFYGAVYN